jgi:hypothetical protein
MGQTPIPPAASHFEFSTSIGAIPTCSSRHGQLVVLPLRFHFIDSLVVEPEAAK